MQWVISMNFKEQDNRADYYLDQIQRKQDRLDQASATIQKYNQALLQAQTGSDDLATLQLTRVVEANPRFVKAHLLLALLHISHEDYTKAGKSLYKVLKIDKNNPKANWYMEIVKEHTGKADIERRKLKTHFPTARCRMMMSLCRRRTRRIRDCSRCSISARDCFWARQLSFSW